LDWKICFMKWADMNDKMADYHVYTEDDSFVCTENILHQTTILRNLPQEKKSLPFRTGTPMWDGFDDSSTFMSKEIAVAFARHYPEDQFNCSRLANHPDPSNKNWLSWGNSWRWQNCGWRGALQDHLNLSINLPIISRTYFNCPPERVEEVANRTSHPTTSPSTAPSGNVPYYTVLYVPCSAVHGLRL
jgi:hypothetical protein